MQKQITYKETYNPNAKKRESVRVILLDHNNHIALMHVGIINFYTLPGGGIDENETAEQAVLREIHEETGCACEIIRHLGTIEENSKTCEWNGISHCYLTRVAGEKGIPQPTQLELDEKESVCWFSFDEVFDKITNQELRGRDAREDGILWIIRERDICMLNESAKEVKE